MAELTYIGEFRELGFPNGPSMTEVVGRLPEHVRAGVEQYIRNGIMVGASPGSTSDVLDGETHLVSASLMTDGVCLWRLDLGHYVRKYGIGLPAEFVDRAVRAAQPPVELTVQQQTAVSDAIRRLRSR